MYWSLICSDWPWRWLQQVLRYCLPLVVVVGASTVLATTPTRRVAMVIGNAAYSNHDKLKNPRADAELLGQTLQGLGFDVVERVADVDQLTMLTALSNFKARATGADLAVIYYSGHGMKHLRERQNYVLPVDMPDLAGNANLDPDIVLQSRAVSESALLAAMSDARYQLLILDACRDNGGRGAKSGDKGLTRRAGVGPGRLIAYATEENRTAKDGTGRYSPYAESLAKNLRDNRLSIVQALDATAVDVRAATANAQQPMKAGDLAWDIRFDLALAGQTQPGAGEPTTLRTLTIADPDATAWQLATRANTAQAYKAYLTEFPSGRFRGDAAKAIGALSAGPAGAPQSVLAALTVQELPSRINQPYSDVFAIASNGLIAANARSAKQDGSSVRPDVLLYDAKGGELARLVAAKNSVTGLQFSPDSQWLAASDYNDNCHVWNARDYRLLRTIERAGRCHWLAGSSEQLLVATRFGGIATHAVSSGKTTVWQRATGHYLRHVAANGLVVTEKDDKLWFWRSGPESTPAKFDLPKDAFAAFGSRLFYVGTESEVNVIDLATLRRVSSYPHGLQTHGDFAQFSLRPSPDERMLAIAMTIGSRSTVKVLQTQGWAVLYEGSLRSSGGLYLSAWSPDSARFAFNAGYDQTGNNPRIAVLDVQRKAAGYADGRFVAVPIFAADSQTLQSPAAEYRVE